MPGRLSQMRTVWSPEAEISFDPLSISNGPDLYNASGSYFIHVYDAQRNVTVALAPDGTIFELVNIQ